LKIILRPIAILICIMIVFSNFVYADTAENYVLYSVKISNGKCTLRGRQFVESNIDISLKVEKQSGGSASPIELTSVCGSDGSFEFQFDIEYTLYKLKLKSTAGVYETEMDFSGISELFTLGKNKGFEVGSIVFEENVVTITGMSAVNTNIAMSIVDEENYDTLGFDAIKAVVQTKSDENGEFKLKFKTVPGDYVLNIKIGSAVKETTGTYADGWMVDGPKGAEADKINELKVQTATGISYTGKNSLYIKYNCTDEATTQSWGSNTLAYKNNWAFIYNDAITEAPAADTTYTLTFYMKSVANAEAEAANNYIMFFMGNNTIGEGKSSTYHMTSTTDGVDAAKAADGWKKYTATFTDISQKFKMQLQLKGEWYIDDISLVDDNNPTVNLLENGDFEPTAEDSCRYAPHTFIDELVEYGEYYNGFLNKLNGYAETLKNLIGQCEARDIPTDYEAVNLGIIKRYISLIENEANHEDFSRMGQYDYALTRLYKEAKESLIKYLDGEKTSVSVPKYVTSDIISNGKSVRAMTDTGEERTVFFTGFGNWETVADEIPYFSEIGLNAIQTEISMSNVFVQDKIDVWGVRKLGGSEALFEVVDGAGESGDRALKVTNSGEYVSHKYKYIYQDVNVKPNTTYMYGLSAKGLFDNKKAIYFNMDGLSVANRQYIDEKSDGWKSYTGEYTTGENQTSIKFTILVEHPVNEVYIDDAFVKEKGSDFNLIENGDFETVRENNRFDLEAEKLGFYINYEQIDYLREVLEKAEQNNVLVDIGVCPHYMPDFILNSDPEITDGIVGSFTPYSLEHPTIRTVASLYARLIASVLNEYESVHTLCLTNEPGVFANYSDNYNELWREYLVKKYQTVDNLKEVYGYSANFDNVVMPEDADENWKNGFVEATPIYYDYRYFNDMLLADFHKFLAEEVRKEETDLLLHTKIMDYFRYDYKRYLSEGTNWELLSEYMDVNGCDAHSYYENSNTPMTMKMAWYDFMTSVKNAPVWDTESHIIDDSRTITYSDEITNYIESEIWNSAIHGRAAGIYWIWDLRDASMPWGTSYRQNSNFAMRPEETARIAKANLDLNRLSSEVTALQNAKTKTAILYSRTSQGYNTEYMNILGKAYEDLIYSGQKVGFLTDSHPEDMGKYELLVIPEATNVSKDMLDCIKTYVENGGSLLLLGENSLKRDEHNNLHNSDTVSFIYSNAETQKSVVEKVKLMQLSEVYLVDAQTGEKAENIEWSYVELDGKMLVNIMNHDRISGKAKTVKLMYGDKQISDMCELRENETISDVVTIKPLEAKLISFDIYELDLVDKNGLVLEENIDTLKSGMIKCDTEAKGSIVLALYKDGELIDVSIDTGIIEVSADESGTYSLMIADWDMNKLSPNKGCRRLTMEVQ